MLMVQIFNMPSDFKVDSVKFCELTESLRKIISEVVKGEIKFEFIDVNMHVDENAILVLLLGLNLGRLDIDHLNNGMMPSKIVEVFGNILEGRNILIECSIPNIRSRSLTILS